MAKYSILIADDDESQRVIQKLVLNEMAQSMGAELKIDEAVDSVQTKHHIEHDKYDLIILDNEFKDDLAPGHLPGIALLQLMRKGGPNASCPTVFLTGDPYETLRPMAEKYKSVYYPKAQANAEEMAKLYGKLLLE